MIFTSPSFLFLFLPIVILLYYVSTSRVKNLTIFLCSLFFYSWGEGIYVLLMLFSIGGNYVFGLYIGGNQRKKIKNYFLSFAILFNLGILFYYKYAGFFVGMLNDIFDFEVNSSPVHLPLGISFFTFQSISYIVDVYRGEVEPQKKLINLGLYISLFPQLIAGPIVRYSDINLQLKERKHSFKKFSEGVYRFSIGLFKKVIIANPLGYVADQIFELGADELSMPISWIGILCYTFQIYFDFSGYSDMAIGLGRMFGFKLEENFNHPYISKSIQEFWRRWHISLSTWFRDYLYIPMGGNRVSKKRLYINLFTVFFLTGLWHGASWNFIVWGLFHGVFISLERIAVIKKFLIKYRYISHVYTLFVVIISWVFFRSPTLPSSLRYIKSMFNVSNFSLDIFELRSLISNEMIIVIILAILLSLPLRNKIEAYLSKIQVKGKIKPIYVYRFAFIFISLLFVFSKIASSAYNPFIYFRF